MFIPNFCTFAGVHIPVTATGSTFSRLVCVFGAERIDINFNRNDLLFPGKTGDPGRNLSGITDGPYCSVDLLPGMEWKITVCVEGDFQITGKIPVNRRGTGKKNAIK